MAENAAPGGATRTRTTGGRIIETGDGRERLVNSFDRARSSFLQRPDGISIHHCVACTSFCLVKTAAAASGGPPEGINSTHGGGGGEGRMD